MLAEAALAFPTLENNSIFDLIPAAVEAVKNETVAKMELFSSCNKAQAMAMADREEMLVQRVVEEVCKQLRIK